MHSALNGNTRKRPQTHVQAVTEASIHGRVPHSNISVYIFDFSRAEAFNRSPLYIRMHTSTHTYVSTYFYICLRILRRRQAHTHSHTQSYTYPYRIIVINVDIRNGVLCITLHYSHTFYQIPKLKTVASSAKWRSLVLADVKRDPDMSRPIQSVNGERHA